MKILLTIVWCLSITLAASAQTKKLRWTTETCELEGSYNARRYSERQLRDTLKLIAIYGFRIETDATPRKIADVRKINVAALDREYDLKLAQIKNLNLVKSAFWESVRRKKLREFEQIYRLSRTTLLAYETPAAIREYASAASCVKKICESFD